MPPTDTALVLLVPEAEALAKPFRDRHDPSAESGMPAHITLLYPFIPPADLAPVILDNLRDFFAAFEPFSFALTEVKRLPGVLYLAPEPDEPFRGLTRAIWTRYPEWPPYAGKHSSILPHLTVAQYAEEQQLDAVADDFERASQGALPIQAAAHEITLMDNCSGRWQIHTTFQVGS